MLQSFFDKVAVLQIMEKRLQHWCFPLHVRKFLKTPLLKNISKRLLLIILLVQHFICFPMSFYNYKEKLIFGWIKCSVKLDYAIEWGIFLKTLSKSLKGKIHCEIFLSEHFMKYSFRVISWKIKCFHEILLL